MSSSCSQPSPVKRASSEGGSRRARSRPSGGRLQGPATAEAEHVAYRVVRLDEAVTVEQDALALLQDYLLLLVAHPRQEPQRRIPVALSSSAPSLRPARRRRADRVPRWRRRDGRSRGRDRVQAGDEHVGWYVGDEDVVDASGPPPARRALGGGAGMLRVVAMTMAAGTPLSVTSPTTSPCGRLPGRGSRRSRRQPRGQAGSRPQRRSRAAPAGSLQEGLLDQARDFKLLLGRSRSWASCCCCLTSWAT